MNLSELIERAAGVLPEGWTVLIEVENGSACINIEYPRGHDCTFEEHPDESLEENFRAAVEYAQANG